MASELNAEIAELKTKVDGKAAAVAREREARSQLVDNAYKLQSLDTHLDSLQEQLHKLDGFSLDNIVYSLLGRKQQQIASYTEQIEAFRRQHDECEQAIHKLEAEVANLERQMHAYGDVEDKYERLLASKRNAIAGSQQSSDKFQALNDRLEAANGVVNRVAKAAEAAEELMRDIRDNVDILSSLGRCRVAEGSKEVTSILNSGRRSTAKLVADHVRQGLRRFNGRLGESLRHNDMPNDETLAEMAKVLDQYARRFNAQWFYNLQDAEESTSNVYDKLYIASSLIDKHLNEARQQVRQVEAERRAFLESA